MSIEIMSQSFVTENPTRVYTINGGGDGGETKTPYDPYSSVYDGNASTYWGALWDWWGDDGVTTLVTTAETTWTENLKISAVTVSAYMLCDFDGDSYTGEYQTYTLYLKIDGDWTQITTQNTVFPSKHDSSNTTSHDYSSSAGWSNVTGIRYVLTNRGSSQSSEYSPGQHITSTNKIYTISALIDWADSGIRVRNGASTISIASHTLDGDKLRYNDSGTIKGIPLVATTSGFASPIRIKTGTDILALPEYS